MKAAFLHPAHPERTCWGCDRLCPANDLGCGNGTVRTQHPAELLGDDWLDFADRQRDVNETAPPERSACRPEAEGQPPESTDL